MEKGRYAGMVLIPTEPFTIGRDDGPPEEKPAHRVFLPVYYNRPESGDMGGTLRSNDIELRQGGPAAR